MREDNRIETVKSILFDYVKSPSLRHIRDPHSLDKLAREIIGCLNHSRTVWQKWDELRENLLKSTRCCWIPVEDIREFLNRLPGPSLTMMDVTQRLKAFEEEELWEYPNEELRAGCLEIYKKEKLEGTELPAIVHLLREHIEQEAARLRIETEERYKQWREEDRLRREQRLLSGADCGWMQLAKSPHWFCRSNGRTYRLSPTKDKKWDLYRIASITDHENGTWIGKYQHRGDATKVVAEIAYRPE